MIISVAVIGGVSGGAGIPVIAVVNGWYSDAGCTLSMSEFLPADIAWSSSFSVSCTSMLFPRALDGIINVVMPPLMPVCSFVYCFPSAAPIGAGGDGES